MSDLDLGHGFIPRIDQSNYRALGRALGPRSLFDPSEVRLPWVLLDGTWVVDYRDVLGQLEAAGTRYLIDTAPWRFQHPSAQTVTKLTALDHAPTTTWSALTLDDYRRFVAYDLRLQATLGAGAYLVPGLIPTAEDEDLSAYDEVAASVVEDVCFEQPLPVVGTVGFHTQGLEIARHRLQRLSGAYSAVYLQATPIDPYHDSASKLGNVVDLLIDVQADGLDVIAGRMGALTVPLRALGIAAADAGLATGESFQLTSKLRAPQRSASDDGPRKMASQASRRYLRPIKRSVAPKVIDTIEAAPAANALLRCDGCCRYLVPDDRVRRGREHSLVARVTEAQEISALPRSMRIERAEREWVAARRHLTAVNRALRDAGAQQIKADCLDNQLAVIRSAAARSHVA
jgi:hypothetical protein